MTINIIFEGTTNGEISYLYNAVGQKLQKKVVNATTDDVTDYVNGYQYLNTKLEFFPHAEGYVKYTPPAGRGLGIYSYVFNYTDHLEGGALKKCPVNIFSERARWREERVSYGKDPATNVLKILEENHYYPFGMKHQNYNVDHLDFNHYPGTGVALVPLPAVANASYNYKYNGKELQEELGLNMYDYGARNYDPALGRWMNVDPLAETSRRWSTFTYCYNNPLRFTDPDGMRSFDNMNPNQGEEENDDWIKNGNTAFYDPTIKTQKQAVEVYGEDAKRMGEGSRTYSRTDGVEDGRYSYTYHDDGTVTDKNGNQVDFSNGNLTTEGGTTIVNPNNKQGTFCGLSIGGAVGGGTSLEFGFVTDPTGKRAFYVSFGGNFGFGGGVGLKDGVITPTTSNPFSVNDFAGKGSSWSAGVESSIGSYGVEGGGTRGNSFSEYGTATKEVTRPYTYIAGSIGNASPSLSGGLMVSGTRTWIFKLN